MRTVEALLANHDVENHYLIIYSDAGKTKKSEKGVEAVREYIGRIDGFRGIEIRKRQYNYGLAKSVIEGVTEVLMQYERVIVLEDDMVTSPHFLNYMNEGLDRFANDNRVISIHGYVYPLKHNLSKPFFLRGADCWGWATWGRGWKLFNHDARALLAELKARDLIKEFNFNGAYDYYDMLKSQAKGINDSWAIRWYASAFLSNKLTLYPNQSLVNNIGNDNSGTHCGDNSSHDIQLSTLPVNLSGIEVRHSDCGFKEFECFFRQAKASPLQRIYKRLLRTLSWVRN